MNAKTVRLTLAVAVMKMIAMGYNKRFDEQGGIIMKTILNLISCLFMNVAEASASSASSVLWHEVECPEELLK